MGRSNGHRPRDADDAARMLYDLALTFQERSQRSEARLARAVRGLARRPRAHALGDRLILDDEDERLWFKRQTAAFEAEVMPERERGGTTATAGDWRASTSAEEMVQFYDPTDLFGDLAEALAEQYPAVAAGARRATTSDA